MATIWIEDDVGTLTFTCQGWTLTRYASTPTDIYAHHADKDYELDISDEGISVKGESQHGYDTYALTVSIPYPILRAIIEVVAPL